MLYPGAEWHPVVNFGYPQGTHGQLAANGPRGSFWHDAQGWKGGAEATFNTKDRGGAHIIFNLVGPPWQFIHLHDAAWHAGGRIPTGFHELANLFYWGFEFEGGYPDPKPITEHQIVEAVKLHLWLAEHYPIKWVFERRVDLWEHREVYNTGCPNDRIPWPEVIARLKGGNQVTELSQNQRDEIAAIADKKAADRLNPVLALLHWHHQALLRMRAQAHDLGEIRLAPDEPDHPK
jgi:N-acetyl-anhydromuramyl-L-alanine amidase AmpD